MNEYMKDLNLLLKVRNKEEISSAKLESNVKYSPF